MQREQKSLNKTFPQSRSKIFDTEPIIADSGLEFHVSEKEYTLSKKINFACQYVHRNKNEVEKES